MRQAIRHTWPVTAIGITITALVAVASYYFEYEALAKRAVMRNEQILLRAQDRFQRLVWHVELAADYMEHSDPRLNSAVLSNFLTRLEPDMPSGSSWMVSQIVPSSQQDLVLQDIRTVSGIADAKLSGDGNAGEKLAPVVFASQPWLPQTVGFDLLSVADLKNIASLSQTPADGVKFDFVSHPLKQTLWAGGSLFVSQVLSPSASDKKLFVLTRVVPLAEMASLLEIDDGRQFAAQSGVTPGSVVGNAALVGQRGIVSRQLTLKPQGFRVSVDPLKPPRPSVWIPLAFIGTMLTAIFTLVMISRHLGARSRSDQEKLFGAQLSLDRIRTSEEALFENAGTANCVIDYASGRFLRVNSRMVELLGYSQEELLSKRFADVTHPDDIAASQGAADSFSRHSKPYLQFEKRYLHKGGQVLYCLVNSRVVRAAQGEPEALATAILDISESKAQERLRDNLVRELAHRVRNTVQLTASIARQTAKSARSVRDYDDKFQKRLNALRAAQDALFDANWTAAPLDIVVKESLAPFKSATAGQKALSVSVPGISLAPQHAQTLAIAVHELAANSSVWGALGHNGEAKLMGFIKKSESGDVLVLEWSETSNFSVRPPRKRGFGMRMLEIGLPEQFSGRVELKWRKHGLFYRAELPLANMLPG